MRGSAAFRTGVAPGGALAGPWVRNPLWTAARAVPSLDLRFADNKSLVDATTGSNLVTFTRASSGTFVGSNGVLRSAVTNLLLRSEEFNTGWSTAGITVAANTSTAPNGTVTADTITENSATDPHLLFQTTTASGTCTFSIYVKQGSGSRFFTIGFNRAATHFVSATFDLALGTNTQTLVLGYSGQSASITAVGDGYYRCSVTAVSDTVSDARIGLASTSTHTSTSRGFQSYTGDGTSNFIVWGAQLEQSSSVGEYIPTTSTINSAPRFDHNPTTGESLGLLVEEQRTNLSLRSQELDNAAWTKTASSITANAVAAPDGTTTADKLVEDSSTGNHNISDAATITYTSGVAYTFSFFVKKAERQTVQILMHPNPFPGTVAQRTAVFNSNTGAFVSVGSAYTGSSVTALPDSWYRVSVSSTADATSTGNFTVTLCSDDTGTTSYTGDGTSGIYIWGAQLEAGAFPTSYIPTTSATVTRSADVASISGSNFSAWYRQDEGTVFADNTNYGVSNTRIASFSDNSTSNRFAVARGTGSGGNINTTVTVGGVVQVSSLILASSLSFGLAAKAAVAVKASDFAGSLNGLTPVTQATGSMPTTLSQLTIGNGEVLGTNTFSGTIRRLVYWGQRLPNSTLQSITQ